MIEALLWLAGIAGGTLTIWQLIEKIAKPIAARNRAVSKMLEHDREQYLAILRLTIMSSDMPISERLLAGEKYITAGGNGDVAAYYKKLIAEHTV